MAMNLVPGFMLDADPWSDMARDLEPLGPFFHANPKQATSIEGMAAEALAEAPETFALVGFSMDGRVAREIQRQAPERVSKLVLVATSARGDNAIRARRKTAVAKADPATFRGLSKKSIRQSLPRSARTAPPSSSGYRR